MRGILEKDWRSIASSVQQGKWDKILASLYRLYYQRRDHKGVDVAEEDWDYLIILDACRFDMFRNHHTLDCGHLDKKVSVGAHSGEFYDRNWNQDHEDIVMVTANPHASGLQKGWYDYEKFDGNEHFHDMKELYFEDNPRDEAKLSPEYVIEHALETVEEYPNKRIAVHIMSPHDPYIGPSALDGSVGMRGYRKRGYTWDEIKQLYIEDLHRALDAVKTFIEQVNGKIVVTADHGETFGEYGLIKHPHGVHIKELVEVPWYVIEKGERPEIIEDPEELNIDI